ncbi:heavy-metal-associated domain-containing protein [Arthrobacter sp. HY1533]|uniref:heavy-metal-associated domain-containing protein n=1 Tax=Arthrobacter sp. HY1533 TaxID=2970919 RepID=UPI0022B9E80E|nr:heavy metal-associated domain-containing protein [Arthrobacter sp. HY1533]
MCGTDIRNDLPLTPAAESSCGCCTPAPAASAPAEGTAYGVEGLTCGSCVQTVQKAVAALDGVDSATVALVAGGTSTLTVAGPASAESVRAAVSGAGYSVTA